MVVAWTAIENKPQVPPPLRHARAGHPGELVLDIGLGVPERPSRRAAVRLGARDRRACDAGRYCRCTDLRAGLSRDHLGRRRDLDSVPACDSEWVFLGGGPGRGRPSFCGLNGFFCPYRMLREDLALDAVVRFFYWENGFVCLFRILRGEAVLDAIERHVVG